MRTLWLALVLVAVPVWAAGVRVIDGMGRAVVLPRPPQRIVSLVPSATEMLYALGAGDRVVGVTDNDNYPPMVSRKPHVGDIHIDFERVLALQPDLVVLEGKIAPQTLARLESLHVPSLALESGTLSNYRHSLLTLGKAIGAETQAQQSLAALQRRLDDIQRRTRNLSHPKVFVEIWDSPLQTAGSETFVDELVRLAGGTNVFSDLRDYPRISPEALLGANPDVVVLTTSTPEVFAARPGFAHLAAVQAGHVYRVSPPDTIVRPTPRLGEGLQKLFTLLHP